MFVLPPPLMTDVITGYFCRLFGPVSASQLSFGSTQLGSPSKLRSIPRPALEKMELPSKALLIAPELCTQIPAKEALHSGVPPPLKAMMLRVLVVVPPTVLPGPLR